MQSNVVHDLGERDEERMGLNTNKHIDRQNQLRFTLLPRKQRKVATSYMVLFSDIS